MKTGLAVLFAALLFTVATTSLLQDRQPQPTWSFLWRAVY